MSVVLSIDQSTSGTKGMVWGLDGKLLARADLPHHQIVNEQNWVEHDPIEIYENVINVSRLALEMAGIIPSEVAAIGISNQRETAVCWDRKTGQPPYNAVVWQYARAVDVVETLRAQGLEETVRKRTGLALSPYFSGAKFGWMVKHLPEVQQALKSGRLCCGTVDSWLLFKLTGEFKTDFSNAGRTQLLNLDTLRWDEELVQSFGLNLDCLPEICYSDSLFGYTDLCGLLPSPVAVHGVAGDSHAALYGNRCRQPFTAKATYGTGSSVMQNVGKTRPTPEKGVSACVAYSHSGEVIYALESNINYAGAVTKWLVGDIGLLPDSKSAGVVASSVADNGGVYLVPAFSECEAAFVGMNRGTKREHLVRAAEECIAYQVCDIVTEMNRATSSPLSILRVDGGPTRDNFLVQFQSDILGIPLEISETEELSGFGAACLAAVGAGLCAPDEMFKNRKYRTVSPTMSDKRRDSLYLGWQNAVDMIKRR